jgi:methanethiol S-methyltransferase
MKYLLICLIWGAYCFLHSLLISTWFTRYITRLLKKYYAFYRLFYVLISTYLLIILINYTDTFNSEIIITYVFPWSIIRSVLMYGSLLLFFYAFFFNYDSLSFFGIRQILNLHKVNENNSTDLIKKNGLLGIIRHPMYLTLLIFLWCQTSKMMDVYLNIVLTIYLIIGTWLEEKKLVLEFGEAYIQYQKEVPMLIPFIKKNFS